MDRRVLLGFSGGMDSCEAASILRRRGYEVTALTLDMDGDAGLVARAKAKAIELGIDFIVKDVSSNFAATVKSYFASEYLCGRTPAPCSLCNPRIKWRYMKEVADAYGIEYLSTGHYFGMTVLGGKYYVTRPVDKIKDQTYYLWGLDQETLGRIVTPMADIRKSDLRIKCDDDALLRESMGVCFLKGRSYRELLREWAGHDITWGNIINKAGEIVGRHEGYPYYTIGQKRGFEMDGKGCIIDIDPENNLLTVGEDSDLYHKNLVVGSTNIVDMDELMHSGNISVMIRGIGRNPEGFCRIRENIGEDDDSLLVELDNPAWAAAKGQPVVFYFDDRVVGGGILENYY